MFPIEEGAFPLLYVSLPEANSIYKFIPSESVCMSWEVDFSPIGSYDHPGWDLNPKNPTLGISLDS